MSKVTTHVLDISIGKPAAELQVNLFAQNPAGWDQLGAHHTNHDGRIMAISDHDLPPGIYKLQFLTQSYYNSKSIQTFYPFVEITFQLGSETHYHVPLLLSPYGYSTYRGS